MLSKSILSYINFGTCLRYLQDVREGTHIRSEGYIIYNINTFFRKLGGLDLPVTTRASDKLTKFKEQLEKVTGRDVIESTEATQLHEIIKDIRTVLEAEAEGNLAYIVTDKRLSVDKLLNNISSLMGPGAFEKMPAIAKYDFEEAGKCIAFELPTSAAFHILRATESVLRQFYFSVVRRNRIKNLLWGPILFELNKKRVKNESLLKNLDDIRVTFRNPTDHPELRYDIEEVQDLFSRCVDAINRMTSSPSYIQPVSTP